MQADARVARTNKATIGSVYRKVEQIGLVLNVTRSRAVCSETTLTHAMWLSFLDNFRNNTRNLVDVKRRWDPENYFHHPQSIPVS